MATNRPEYYRRRKQEEPTHSVWRLLERKRADRTMRVLLVETDATLRAHGKRLTNDGRFNTVPAATDREMIKRLEEEHFDLVVVSWSKGSGFDCRELIESAREINCEVPILLAAFEPSQHSAHTTGADAVIDTRKFYYQRAFGEMTHWIRSGRRKPPQTENTNGENGKTRGTQ